MVMFLSALRSRTPHHELSVVQPVDPGKIIEWPHGPVEVPATQPVTISADIRTKRFSGAEVLESSYAANLVAGDNAPSTMMAALIRAMEQIEELSRAAIGGEPVILELRLQAS